MAGYGKEGVTARSVKNERFYISIPYASITIKASEQVLTPLPFVPLANSVGKCRQVRIAPVDSKPNTDSLMCEVRHNKGTHILPLKNSRKESTS